MPVSVGPSGPTESSPAVPAGGFSTWFKNIIDWLRSLSPAGATDYDTGWVSITPNAGFTSTDLAVRRIGKSIWVRGGVLRVAGDFPATFENVFTIPAGFRPVLFTRQALGTFATVSQRALTATYSSNGVVQVAATGGSYNNAFFNVSWLVD